MKPQKPEVVVVTGGTAGVGRATVRAFAAQGAAVGIIARNRERLESTKREVEELGGRALALSADVADPDQIENAAEQIERELGPIDIWVNNAMTSVFAPFKEIRPEEFRRVTEVTYLGQVYGTMAALKRMLKRNSGTIVQVGSALAIRSVPLQAPYCGAKHGVRGFTDSIRSELMHDGSDVHITMVQLPAMNTPQFDWVRSKLSRKAQPVPPIFQPEVGAEAIVWAARHRRREVYVGASTTEAIAGQKIAPHLLDKYLARTNYEAQQTDEAEDPGRPDNLFEPVPGDYEAHGRFDERSRTGSVELWVSTHKKKIGWGIAATGFAAAAGILMARRNDRGRLSTLRRGILNLLALQP